MIKPTTPPAVHDAVRANLLALHALGSAGFACNHRTAADPCSAVTCGWSQDRLDADRARLRSEASVNCIVAVAEWLAGYTRSKTVTRQSPDLASLRRRIAWILRAEPRVNGCVSTGQMIVAALATGFRLRHDAGAALETRIGLRRRDFLDICSQTAATAAF